MKRSSLMLVVLALLIGGPSHAFAHAHLKGSQPVAGSSVEVAPRALTLSFTERIPPTRTSSMLRSDHCPPGPTKSSGVSSAPTATR
jgi:methionine-rich copper-binding protein CopC